MKKMMVYILDACFVEILPVLILSERVKTIIFYDATTLFTLVVVRKIGLCNYSKVFIGFLSGIVSDNKRWNHFFVQQKWFWWYCKKLNGYLVTMCIYCGVCNFGSLVWSLDFHQLYDARYGLCAVGAGMTCDILPMLSKHLIVQTTVDVGYSCSGYGRLECKCRD